MSFYLQDDLSPLATGHLAELSAGSWPSGTKLINYIDQIRFSFQNIFITKIYLHIFLKLDCDILVGDTVSP